MKKLILTFLLSCSASPLICMEITTATGSANASTAVIERATHEQQVASLQAQIQAKETAIKAEKLKHAKAIVSMHRRWDIRNAIAPAAFTLLIGGKAAYDVYTLLYTKEVPAWFNYTNLTLDGAMLLYTGGKTTCHLMLACCRKPKVE